MVAVDAIVGEVSLADVWGITWSDSRTLDQLIGRLRRKLEIAP